MLRIVPDSKEVFRKLNISLLSISYICFFPLRDFRNVILKNSLVRLLFLFLFFWCYFIFFFVLKPTRKTCKDRTEKIIKQPQADFEGKKPF
jgi:Ca2+/Na+ antiporter